MLYKVLIGANYVDCGRTFTSYEDAQDVMHEYLDKGVSAIVAIYDDVTGELSF
jgi:hypothetical protein